MQFVPPQVLNKSLLNNSLNKSLQETTTLPKDDEPPGENNEKETNNVDWQKWDDKEVEPNNIMGDVFVLENSDSEDEDAQNIVYQDMQLFFHAIGEFQLIELFLKNKVTLGQLLEFDEQDLINCGVELVGDRKKILANTGQMHCEKWMPSSLQDLTTKSLLSSPGIYIALNDINKHIEYIGVTLKYLRRRLQSNPEILELGKDFVGVTKVSSELEDLMKTIKSTHDQALAFDRQIRKHLCDPKLRPANHIDDCYVRAAKWQRIFIAPIIVVVAAVCMTLKIKKSLFY